MARRIVFIGNCQMSILRNLYDRFVTGVTDDDTYFLPTWTALDGQGAAALESADLLVDQVQSFSSEAIERPARIASIPRVPVPLVSATFLWPFAGSAHPLNADSPHLSGGPYPGELGDGFLNRMIKDEVSPAVALERDRQHDLGGPAALDRRYEIVMDQQRQRDAVCGYTVAGEIESRFRREPLFLSPHHPRQQITMVLAQQCLARIGAPQRSIDMLTRNMPGFLFPQDEQPIHPAVARHFGLAYINNETLYAWRGEGRFSFDEWVLRYMRYTWSPALFEGCRAVASDPLRSRAILSEVTERLPRSPLAKAGLNILGTSADSIDIAEDRKRFQQMIKKLKLTGISYNPTDPKSAFCMIEDVEKNITTFLHVGDPVGLMKVGKINEDFVVLEQGNETVEIR